MQGQQGRTCDVKPIARARTCELVWESKCRVLQAPNQQNKVSRLSKQEGKESDVVPVPWRHDDLFLITGTKSPNA